MSTYAQVTDYQNYTPLAVNTPTAGLQALVDRAQRDIDKILPRTEYMTDAIFGLSIPNASSGTFELEFTWVGVTYTTPAIQWNASAVDVVNALQAAVDQYGNLVPLDVWEQPESKYYNQMWAFGPFPSVPIVVQAVNQLGGQPLGPLSVASNSLVFTPSGQITLQTIVEGGLRVNPYQIPAEWSAALRDAVCAQAEYRDQMGEAFFARAQYQSISGPEFRTQGKLPLIGPKVLRELSGTDLIQRGARARPGTASKRQMVYMPVGSTPIPDDWRVI